MFNQIVASLFVTHGFFDTHSIADTLNYVICSALCYVAIAECTDLSMMTFICMSMYHFGADMRGMWSGAVMFGASTIHAESWERALRWLGVRKTRMIIRVSQLLCVIGMFCAPTKSLILSFLIGAAGPVAIFYWAACVHAPMTLWREGWRTSYMLYPVLAYAVVRGAKSLQQKAPNDWLRNLGHMGIAIAATHIIWKFN